MAGHKFLEALSFEVHVDGHETKEFVGSRTIIQNMEKVLVKPGWSLLRVLRQVSFEISIACCLVSREANTELSESLESLPDNISGEEIRQHLMLGNSCQLAPRHIIMSCK